MKNLNRKRGLALVTTFEFLVVSLVMVIILGAMLYSFGIIDASLSGINIMAGSVNISVESANTIGKINTGLLNNADLIGILFLFGMVLAMIINGFMHRKESPQIFFIIDFLIALFAYILAVYISNSYETILNALPYKEIVISNLAKSNRFMLLLPKITLIASALTLIVTYAGIPQTKEEEVGGF